MEAAVSVMAKGAFADPILWILAAVIGWSCRGPIATAIGLLGCAGAAWGALRVAVYVSFGERLGVTNAALMVAVCVAAMLGVGLLVREIRWFFASR